MFDESCSIGWVEADRAFQRTVCVLNFYNDRDAEKRRQRWKPLSPLLLKHSRRQTVDALFEGLGLGCMTSSSYDWKGLQHLHLVKAV